MLDDQHHSIFGAIEQTVAGASGACAIAATGP
jgi:hypothetical protein